VLGRSRCSYPPHPSWHRRGRSRGRAVSPSVFFLCPFPWCAIMFFGRAGRRAQGELAMSRLARTADGKTGQNVCRHDLYRSHASMNKQKKKRTGSRYIRVLSVFLSDPEILDSMKFVWKNLSPSGCHPAPMALNHPQLL